MMDWDQHKNHQNIKYSVTSPSNINEYVAFREARHRKIKLRPNYKTFNKNNDRLEVKKEKKNQGEQKIFPINTSVKTILCKNRI